MIDRCFLFIIILTNLLGVYYVPFKTRFNLPCRLQSFIFRTAQGGLRTNIQASMNDFITSQIIDGKMFVYYAVDWKFLKLSLDFLHEGIVKKDDFYVSCADFFEQSGRKESFKKFYY